MDIVVRVFVGLLLWPFIFMISTFIFTMLTGVINVVAIALAKGTRRIFGLDGTWTTGTELAVTAGVIAKSVAGFCLGLSVFIYAVIPGGASASGWVAAVALGSALVVWMPSLFLASLFSRGSDFLAAYE